MICKKCGTTVDEGASFCVSCGEKMTAVEVNVNEAQAKANKKKTGWIVAVIAVVICFLAIIGLMIVMVSKNSKSTISPKEYISLKYEGYDGLGTVVWQFDKKDFIRDYEEKIAFSSAIKKALKKEDNISEILEVACAMADIDVDDPDEDDGAKLLYTILFKNTHITKEKELSNGEEISIVWDYRESLTSDELEQICKLFKISIEDADEKYRVSGLVEVPVFDPFEGVELSYSGVIPNGKAILANYPSNGLLYTLDASETVVNGDIVKVLIHFPDDNMDEYISIYGKMPSGMEKEYTVCGLAEHITSASQIPEETLAQMQSQAEDIIKGTTYGWLSGYTLDISYIGNYFLIAKKAEETPQNMLILIYKLHYVNHIVDYTGEPQEFAMDYYYYVNWDDLQLKEDGTCVYDKNKYYKTSNEFEVGTNIFSSQWKYDWHEHKLYFCGYQTLDEVYNAYITRNIEDYKFEENYVE